MGDTSHVTNNQIRVATWNVNGLRAAIRKGLDDFVEQIDADIWMFQELRAYPEQLPSSWNPPADMQAIWHPAERKGYSGVSTWSRLPISKSSRGIGLGQDPQDLEGRILVTEHDGLTCINTYLPSGSSKEERQAYKERWMDDWLEWLKPYLTCDRTVIVAGDLNIAHTEIDIWDARSNQNNSGFLPQERAWFGELLNSGWYDLCRICWGSTQGPYTWWSNRGRARAENKGWRIDYILGNKAAKAAFRNAAVVREGGLVVSDHAPVIADFELGNIRRNGENH